MLISFGGGSTIDATKAAEVLCTLGGRIDEYFGTGLVSPRLCQNGQASQAARCHSDGGQLGSPSDQVFKYHGHGDRTKKLIVDDAIVPALRDF